MSAAQTPALVKKNKPKDLPSIKAFKKELAVESFMSFDPDKIVDKSAIDIDTIETKLKDMLLSSQLNDNQQYDDNEVNKNNRAFVKLRQELVMKGLQLQLTYVQKDDDTQKAEQLVSFVSVLFELLNAKPQRTAADEYYQEIKKLGKFLENELSKSLFMSPDLLPPGEAASKQLKSLRTVINRPEWVPAS